MSQIANVEFYDTPHIIFYIERLQHIRRILACTKPISSIFRFDFLLVHFFLFHFSISMFVVLGFYPPNITLHSIVLTSRTHIPFSSLFSYFFLINKTLFYPTITSLFYMFLYICTPGDVCSIWCYMYENKRHVQLPEEYYLIKSK